MKKKTDQNPSDELRPEYAFASMKGGVRGKYVKRYRAGTNIALVEPDVAEAFPTQASVNEELPRHLARYVVGHDGRTVQQESRAGLTNGELLTRADAPGSRCC